MQHPWDNSTIFYQQVKIGGIIPTYEDARNQAADSAAERQIFATPSLFRLYLLLA